MARLRAWAADRDKENDRHSKAIDDIQQGKCSIHGTANPTNTPPDTGGLPLPPETRKQLLKGAAAMDKLLTKGQNATLAGANRFFACLAEAVRSDLRFLAQPGYVPAAQIAQALHEGTWRYLTGNAYANNRALFDGALQSLRQLRDDPACWFGNAAPGAAVGVVTHYAGAAAEAAEVQNAEKAAVRIANEYEERRGYGSSSMGRRGAPNPSNPFNPANAPNMCFPCALAKDLTLETGDPHWAQAYAGNVEIQQINGVPTPVYNITHDPTVHAILRDFYGEKQLQGAPLPPWRLTNQARGIPSAVTDQYGNGLGGVAARRAIENEMKAAGNGSRGLVFLDYPPTPQNPAGTGHVVNVRFVNGRVLFEDASNNNINASMFFNAAAKVSLFRTN
jgi:hypothetical protein